MATLNDAGANSNHNDFDDALTNTLRPLTDCFLTVRIIKSFTFRTTKNLLLPHVDATTVTVGQLKDLCREHVKTGAGFKAYRTCKLDTLKLYTVAHGHKTMDLIINHETDDDILNDDSATLASVGIENESEISFFNRALYDEYKANPQQAW
ncbi:hypothetical protein JCM10908_000145 [Rhodotorula pacifica]|uniref:Aim29p n=1 Tax=Rhodotorula pacifica TaxID=1495444 RepID=UPI003181FA5C